MSTRSTRTLDNSLPIATVERETGIAKDTLRVWERRYGFPQPLRDANGNRTYPLAQVVQLQSIRKLLDTGLRPGKIVGLENNELEELLRQHRSKKAELLSRTKPVPVRTDAFELAAFLKALKEQDPGTLRHLLMHAQAKMGLASFVINLVGPLTTAVGEAWAQGRFEIYEEHLYTEIITGVLHQAIASLASGGSAASLAGPRVLLTTLPDEQHGLGLLMVEVMLTLEGCRCVSLGTQTPICNIVRAAQAHQVDIVALSFTAQLSSQAVLASLHELRALLPSDIALWVGGSHVALYQQPLDGITATPLLTDLGKYVERWRQSH